MKKGIFFSILGLLSLGLAFGLSNTDEKEKKAKTPHNSSCAASETAKPKLDFIYKVSNRFLKTIPLEKASNAQTIYDLMPGNYEARADVKEVRLEIYEDQGMVHREAIGEGADLNATQLDLLKTLSYRSDLHVSADIEWMSNNESGPIADELVLFLTVVPETEAEYLIGIDGLENYLRESSKAQIADVERDNLTPGRVKFNIGPKGNVMHVWTASSCGYSDIDSHMRSLIQNLPGSWSPAKDKDGNPVEQDFTFFYGIMGC